MGHRKQCPHCAGKLKLAGACLSLWAVLSFFAFLPLAYCVQLAAYFPPTACIDSGAGSPDAAILAGKPLSPGDDDACALVEAASKLEKIVVREQPLPEGGYPAWSFPLSDPLPAVSRFNLPVIPPRAPPIFL